MTRTYGKWEPETGISNYGGAVRRRVKQVGWFGFVREWWEWVRFPLDYGIDNHRLCRALNNEKMPLVTLSSRTDGYERGAFGLPDNYPYYFSTEALQAELKRRKQEAK